MFSAHYDDDNVGGGGGTIQLPFGMTCFCLRFLMPAVVFYTRNIIFVCANFYFLCHCDTVSLFLSVASLARTKIVTHKNKSKSRWFPFFSFDCFFFFLVLFPPHEQLKITFRMLAWKKLRQNMIIEKGNGIFFMKAQQKLNFWHTQNDWKLHHFICILFNEHLN